MTLLDAYALVAFLVGGPAARHVRDLLRGGRTAVCTVNLVEVLDVANRLYDVPIVRAFDALEPLFDDALEVIALDVSIARRAAQVRAQHYHRTTRPISLADAVLVASAQSGHSIATSDPDVLAVAEVEGIATVRLPTQG